MQLTVAITSGGTISRIDDVRFIGNSSTGGTGASIAEEFLRQGSRVYYIHNRHAQRPFRRYLTIAPEREFHVEVARISQVCSLLKEHSCRLFEHAFETFEEYYATVEQILTSKPVDVVVLAAAVSDYGVQPTQGKIRSDLDKLTVEMVKYPKVISLVKQWRPGVFQVGFKLLSRSTVEDLIEAGYQSGLAYGSDLTVANTLIEGEFQKRLAVIITPKREYIWVSPEEIALRLVEMVMQRLTLP